MTTHSIRVVLTAEGVICSVCDQPIHWVRPADPPHPIVGYWEHVPVDPDELAASMRRHPAGKGRPT